MSVSTSDLVQLRSEPSADAAYPHGMTSLAAENRTMSATIGRLGHIKLVDFKPSNFVRPETVLYELDGKSRRWDVIESHDSVAVVLFHTGLQAFLMVRQFRPALYATRLRAAHIAGASLEIPLSEGFTCELCAGIVDKDKSLAEIAREEVEEECGFAVATSDLRVITSFASSVGVQGANQTLFYAEVDDAAAVVSHGGVAADGEAIELLALPLDSVDAFIVDAAIPKTSGAMFGLMWAKNAIHGRAVTAP